MHRQQRRCRCITPWSSVALSLWLWSSSIVLLRAQETATPTSTPTPSLQPAPTATDPFTPDDCEACCRSSLSSPSSFSCCHTDQRRNLWGTKHGECSGLPCCTYHGRRAQTHPAWYPCFSFLTCRNDQSKAQFCQGDSAWSFVNGANFTCVDNCCAQTKLESNVWEGMDASAIPGQVNATFGVTFSPIDMASVFDGIDMAANGSLNHPLRQIMIASPLEYAFSTANSSQPHCWIRTASQSNDKKVRCLVSTFYSRTYLTIDIPAQFSDRGEPFVVQFNGVTTPSGIDDSTPSTTFTTDANLSPVHFIFDRIDGRVFSTFLRVAPLGVARLSSGSFLPENIYPGNAGNASLVMYSNAFIPAKSTIALTFGPKWRFATSAIWTYQSIPDETQEEEEAETNSSTTDDGSLMTQLLAKPTPLWSNNFTDASYGSNVWTLVVPEDLPSGWITLAVDRVQNPPMAYSGLNQLSIDVRDPKKRLILQGRIASISVDMVSDATASPYNYVTMVVLIGALLFCTIVIKSNGLAFSYGALWTDLTAICTILALFTALLNNLVWIFHRGAFYFYVSRVHWCFTFTMLTSVCFHWGTVLSLRLRKLPKTTTLVGFVLVNLVFYVFQAVFLVLHRQLIVTVYQAETDGASLLNQQCKKQENNSVFSEIQGYLWSCYAKQAEEKFFFISTTVTYTLFLALTLTVMALGIMVMRRGKSLLGSATGTHQIVLNKALRLYYALIGVVTLVYLLSWVIQLLSRTDHLIPYPWYYIFSVWLPYAIPPCCLIFLQWNSTAKSLREDEQSHTVMLMERPSGSPSGQWQYGAIQTPSVVFSDQADQWSDYDDLVDDDDDDDGLGDDDDDDDEEDGDYEEFSRAPATSMAEDAVGLAMALEMNEDFGQGCFVAVQRFQFDAIYNRPVWKQIANTDTVHGSAVSNGRFLYSFLSVPRIPVALTTEDKLRMVVYAYQETKKPVPKRQDHSEMTADDVLAALDRPSDEDFHVNHHRESSFVDLDELHSARMIDELFEEESIAESSRQSLFSCGSSSSSSSPSSASTASIKCLNVVAEFQVSLESLVHAGARGEQVVVVAAEHSFKHFGPSTLPPKLSVHTVIPKTTAAAASVQSVIATPSSHSISRQYHIREQGLLVVEDLTESRFSNSIPRQILEIIIRYRNKRFLMAQNDLKRLEAFDRQRQKGTDRGIYENLIQQIQDDGDFNRCREWMILRCDTQKQYLDLLKKLRRVYVTRDQRKQFFKPSTEKKSSLLRFLPINLHLQELWVGHAAHTFIGNHENQMQAAVYDIVTVGAMAAHVYKFKNGGILGLEEQRIKMKAQPHDPTKCPLWTPDEQKAADLDWDIQQRMDVCFPQAVAALVTAFTRKLDLALQQTEVPMGSSMLHQLETLGFLFHVESLLSTHGNEAGMLEDMAGALNELRNVRFVLVDQDDTDHSNDEEEEESKQQEPTTAASVAGVVSVDVFTTIDDALSDLKRSKPVLQQQEASEPASPTHSTASSSFAMRHRLMNTFLRAKSTNKRLLQSFPSSDVLKSSSAIASLDRLFEYTHLVIRVTVRTNAIKLPTAHDRAPVITVYPLLFSQGINEKQTLANNTKSSVTRLQDVINSNSLRSLRSYCDRFVSSARLANAPTPDEIKTTLNDLEQLIASSHQTRKKRPEILQASADLCRRMGAGRVTVCKSAKDRTGMSVTLEQGRILVEHHDLPEHKKADVVAVMRSEGVRIENALKNTGRRVFAFNALQRSLLPEEYRCPPQTGGRNLS